MVGTSPPASRRIRFSSLPLRPPMTASSLPTAPHMLMTLVYGSHDGAPTFTTPIGGVGGTIHCRVEDWPLIRNHPLLATPVVYVLLGDHAVARQRLYVGAGHDGANGIAQHLYVKDREGQPAKPWIRSIIAFGATNGDLNIGQVEMMGHLLAAKARASTRVLCKNPKNEPKAPSVNKFDLFGCRVYLATLLRVCATFTRAFIPTHYDISPIFLLKGPDTVCAEGSKSAWRTGDGTSFSEVEDDLRESLAQEGGS